MKKLLAITLAFCLLFAVGCAKEEPAPEMPEPEPVVAEPEPEPEPEPPKAEGGEVMEIRKAEKIGSGIYEGDGEFLSEVKCQPGLLSFDLNNPSGKDLLFGSISPLDSSQYSMDQIAKIIINGRRLDVEKYCGLEGAVLSSESAASCSVEFIPDSLNSDVVIRVGKNDLGEKPVNQITIKAGDHYEGEFVCADGEAEMTDETRTEEYMGEESPVDMEGMME